MKSIKLSIHFVLLAHLLINSFVSKAQVYTQLNMSSGLPTNDFSCIKGISPTNIWVGTFDFGVGHYDGNTWQFYDSINSVIPDNFIHDIEVDKSGNIWVGTSMGVASYDGTNWNLLDSSNSPVKTIGFDTPLHTMDGLSYYYFVNNKIEIDTAGKVWIASLDRLIRIDSSNTYSFYNLPYNPDFANPGMGDSINAILEFSINQTTNNMIAATPHGSSLFFKYNPAKDAIDTLSYNLSILTNDIYGGAFVAVADTIGVWAKVSYTDYVSYTNYGGYVAYNDCDSLTDFYWNNYDSTVCFLEGNPSNAPGYGRLFLENTGKLWASNVNKLSSFDGSTWTSSGLPLAGNISGIDVDTSGLVYISLNDNTLGTSWIRMNGTEHISSSEGIVIYYPNEVVNVPSSNVTRGKTQFYPLPTSESLTVKNNTSVINKILILDITSNIVYEKEFNTDKATCHLNNLENGYYLVKVIYNNGLTEVQKIIIQH